MADLKIEIRLSVPWKIVRWGLAGFLLMAQVGELASEDFTLTTYYPAPSGVYKTMITTAGTVLARNSGNVGVGTTSPQAKLDVAGGINLMADGTHSGPLKVYWGGDGYYAVYAP